MRFFEAIGSRFRGMRVGLPDRVAILLTNPRSGSTLLTDALRCHPSIEFCPSADVYRVMHLLDSDRRYPRDLSNGPDASLRVEMSFGRWELVPVFEIPHPSGSTPARLERETWGIEKIHPESFLFQAGAFHKGIAALEHAGTECSVVYQVRDPGDSIVSCARYQLRRPDWYPELRGRDIVDYTRKTFAMIRDVSRQQEGICFEYSYVVSDLSAVLQRIFGGLWGGVSAAEAAYLRHVADEAVRVTARERRRASGSPFFGARADQTEVDEQVALLLSTWSDEIAECRSIFEEIVGRSTREDGAC